MKARDKYVIGKYLRTLEERFDAKHSVRNKQSSTAQETQNVLNEARRNFFLRERNWEQRYDVVVVLQFLSPSLCICFCFYI